MPNARNVVQAYVLFSIKISCFIGVINDDVEGTQTAQGIYWLAPSATVARGIIGNRTLRSPNRSNPSRNINTHNNKENHELKIKSTTHLNVCR
jgi:hypothetical protein